MQVHTALLPLALVSATVLAFPSESAVEPIARPADRNQETGSVPAKAPAKVAFDHQHTAWNEVLKRHVKGDDFDYAALAQDRTKLNTYLGQLQAVMPPELKSWTKQQRFAFWINAYNAYTIAKVVENYPIDSIKDLSTGLFGVNSIFDKEFIPLSAHHPEGKSDLLSLNDIEHGILRKRFPDARVHAAINCASKSCPPLRGEAIVAGRLDLQLDAQMKAFVNDSTRNLIDVENGKLRLSKIFDWFDDDFERDAGSVRDYLLRYAPSEKHAFLRKAKIKYLDYDWSLNEVEREDG